MSPLFISIIIPNFNSERYIDDTICSVLNQKYSFWELIIVDDGSSDNSCAIINQYILKDPRIKFLKRIAGNKGASACRNIGIENSIGDYIMFLDSDDLLTKVCLEQRIELLQIHPEIDFAVFKMGYFNKYIGDHTGCLNKYTNEENGYLNMFLSYNLPWAITCPIWKRRFIIENNIRFSEKYYRLQDVEFHTKILFHHKPKFHVNKNIGIDCYYRQATNIKTLINESALDKIVNSSILFLTEVGIDVKEKSPDLLKSLDTFTISIFHTLFFYYKLKSINSVNKFYEGVKKLHNIKINRFIITLFYLFNRSRLTFVKGIGISKLWNILYLRY